ncbi:MAG: site-2 protease family protein [Thermodesulfobacteriota bacterium]|nr:site-2 protease family protein [Thermodesulfobacteriota bacterium]
MGPILLLFKNPGAFFILMIPLLYSVIIHEVAHGWVAERMGDNTARWLGRITLNPIKHLDPIGSAMLLLFGFGWAKPVPVNFSNLRDQRKGMILVSAAGITANIIMAFLALLMIRMEIFSPWGMSCLVLSVLAKINLILASFNLIPIPPLDGSKILMGFVSNRMKYQLMQLEPYGMFIIIGLLFFGLLNPLINFFEQIILGIINIII